MSKGKSVFHRDAEGNVSFDKGTCHIEDGQTSALSVLANNFVGDGEVFAKDYFVYKDGKRIRKWFQRRGDIKLLWMPNLERIAWIESIRWRLCEKRDSLWKEISEVIREIHEKGGVAYARPLHSSESSMYWKYRTNDNGSFRFDWADKPKKTRNAKLGQRLYSLEYIRGSALNRRLGLFNYALGLALERNICGEDYAKLRTYKRGQVFRFSINGRLYWYAISVHRGGGLWPSVLRWPESDTDILDMEL